MDSASPAALLLPLLERLDAEPVPILSGSEVIRCPRADLARLLESGLLKELAPLEELGPCDCGLDGCHQIVQEGGDGLWAVCPRGIARPRPLSPEDIQECRVEVPALCQALREANQMDGDAITEFSPTVCFLGQMHLAGRVLPVVLARCLQTRSAESALFAIRGRLTQRQVLLLTPTPRALDLHVLHHLMADGLVLGSLTDILTNADAMVLDRQKIESWLYPAAAESGSSVTLRIDTGAMLCYFRGIQVDLSAMPFDVLVLLAKAAQAGLRLVSRDQIAQVGWPEDGAKGNPASEDQINNVVSEVRRALREAGRMSAKRL